MPKREKQGNSVNAGILGNGARELTPKEIVKELDRYIVGQDKAKRAVAIALRNRYRREQLSRDIKDEVIPKNILMIGPTGVGKTEIARRLARLASAPFLKVEATKFTEVGYVGRDVESMVRDLVEISVQMVKDEKMEEVKEKAEVQVVEKILDLLQPMPKTQKAPALVPARTVGGAPEETPHLEFGYLEQMERARERLRVQLEKDELDDRTVEVEIEETKFPVIEVFAGAGIEEMGMNIQEMLGGMLPKKKRKKKTTVGEAKRILLNQEMQKLIDLEAAVREGVQRAEEKGIIFIDELDKIAGREKGAGPDVSREGVQRDLLPIIEGSTTMTKYGSVKTDHIFFIAAGAFHSSKPSDLIPELQGRFPIRVELDNLTQEDFQKILLEPKNALIKQYKALMAVDGVKVEFTQDGISEIAHVAQEVNDQTENIGARRLHTVMEKLLEHISYEAPSAELKETRVDSKFVRKQLEGIVKDKDLSRYVL